VTLTLRGLEQGEPPRIPYMSPDGLVTASATLPTDLALQAWEQREDGWIGLGYAREGAKVFHLDKDLQVTASETSGMKMAAAADGSPVAYVRIESDYRQTLLSADALDAMSWTFPARSDVEPVGYVGEGAVVYRLPAGGNAEVGIAYGDGSTRPVEGFLDVQDASAEAGLIIGQTREVEGSGCFGVMDPEKSMTSMVWETCDYSLLGFSPDGKHLLASDPYLSGMGLTSLTVLDTTSFEPVVEYTQPPESRMALLMNAWEDDKAILSIVVEESTTSMLRLGLDGRVERVVEPVEGDPFADLPFWFSQTDR
jgi:hypothetical protein